MKVRYTDTAIAEIEELLVGPIRAVLLDRYKFRICTSLTATS